MSAFGKDEHKFQERLHEIRKRYEHLDDDEYILALMNDKDYQQVSEEIVASFNPYNYTDDRANDALGKPRIGETMEDFKKRTQQQT